MLPRPRYHSLCIFGMRVDLDTGGNFVFGNAFPSLLEGSQVPTVFLADPR